MIYQTVLVMRMEDYNPESIIYVTDKRQELHFKQVFRCAKKTGIVKQETELKHIGFGTMNGKDGKPFKTRDGGVMRLEYLVNEINEEMLKKIVENQQAKEIKSPEQVITAGTVPNTGGGPNRQQIQNPSSLAATIAP